jgi:hypothetical protein
LTKTVEKDLGYNYSVTENSIMLNLTKVNERADTKRSILSEISKAFDHLGLVSTLTVRGKFFLRDLWALKLEWVSAELQEKWVRLCSELRRLNEAAFSRKSIGSKGPTKVVALCDASEQDYGCAIYTTQEDSSSLLFSKVKIALLKTETLPTFEHLSVFLAVKCLKNILIILGQSVCLI